MVTRWRTCLSLWLLTGVTGTCGCRCYRWEQADVSRLKLHHSAGENKHQDKLKVISVTWKQGECSESLSVCLMFSLTDHVDVLLDFLFETRVQSIRSVNLRLWIWASAQQNILIVQSFCQCVDVTFSHKDVQVRTRADELVKIFCSLLAEFSVDQFQRYFYDFICNKIFVVEGPDVFTARTVRWWLLLNVLLSEKKQEN